MDLSGGSRNDHQGVCLSKHLWNQGLKQSFFLGGVRFDPAIFGFIKFDGNMSFWCNFQDFFLLFWCLVWVGEIFHDSTVSPQKSMAFFFWKQVAIRNQSEILNLKDLSRGFQDSHSPPYGRMQSWQKNGFCLDGE